MRECMLARRTGRPAPCREACPFWEQGGAVVAAGCALERIQPEKDWSPELAQRWLQIRAAAGRADDWQPTSFFSQLLG